MGEWRKSEQASRRARWWASRLCGAQSRLLAQSWRVMRRTPTSSASADPRKSIGYLRLAVDVTWSRVKGPRACEAQLTHGQSQPTSVKRGRLSYAAADRGRLWCRLPEFVAHRGTRARRGIARPRRTCPRRPSISCRTTEGATTHSGRVFVVDEMESYGSTLKRVTAHGALGLQRVVDDHPGAPATGRAQAVDEGRLGLFEIWDREQALGRRRLLLPTCDVGSEDGPGPLPTASPESSGFGAATRRRSW